MLAAEQDMLLFDEVQAVLALLRVMWTLSHLARSVQAFNSYRWKGDLTGAKQTLSGDYSRPFFPSNFKAQDST
jgi:hypothetical protein